MTRIAAWLARRLWWAMLWLMRRRWIRRLQRASYAWLPPKMQERSRASLVRQNELARRYGLRLLTATITLFLLSVAATGAFFVFLRLYDAGLLRRYEPSAPEETPWFGD